MKIDKKIMTIAGLDYAVSIWGSGKIIFALHGFSESSSTWQKLSLTGYKIVAIDLLGHGSSAKPDTLAPYKLDQVLSDLHLLFTQFADGKPFHFWVIQWVGGLRSAIVWLIRRLPLKN